MVLLGVSQGQATIIRVSGDQPTIQTGIDAATGGDTVEGSAGTYTDFAAKGILVRSVDGPDSTIIQPLSLAIPIITFSNNEPRTSVLTGFTVTGSNGAPAGYISGSSPWVRHNVFRGHAGLQQDHVVIRAAGGGHALIALNTLYDNVGHWSILYSDADSLTFTNNTIDGGERGLLVYSSGSIVKNNIVVNCSKYGFWNDSRSMIRTYNDIWNNDVNYWSTMTPDVTAGTNMVSRCPAESISTPLVQLRLRRPKR
jgi:parallel beta-helix repeat protein